MSNTSTLRFQKYDKFNNMVFIASESQEPESLKQLTSYEIQLCADYDHFIPIYSSQTKGFATVRFKKDSSFTRLKCQATYTIKYDIKKIRKKEKVYVNCHLRKVKLVKEAPIIEEGTDILFALL